MTEKTYTVISPVKAGGKLHPVGATVTLDEQIAGELVGSHLNEVKPRAQGTGQQSPPAKGGK